MIFSADKNILLVCACTAVYNRAFGCRSLLMFLQKIKPLLASGFIIYLSSRTAHKTFNKRPYLYLEEVSVNMLFRDFILRTSPPCLED